MRVLPLISLIAPLWRLGPARNAAKSGLVLFSVILAGFIGVFSLLAATFIAIGTHFGFDWAFLAVAILTLSYVAFYLIRLSLKPDPAEKASIGEDSVLMAIPEHLRETEAVQSFITFTQDHPYGALAAASIAGFAITQSLEGDS